MFNISDSSLLSDSRAELWQQLRRKDNESGALTEDQRLYSEFTEFGKAVGWLLLVLLIFTIILSMHRCPTLLNCTKKQSKNDKDGCQTADGDDIKTEERNIDQFHNSVSQLTKPLETVSCISSLHLENLLSESNSFFIHVPWMDENIKFDVVSPVITPFIRRRVDFDNDLKNSEMLNIRGTESNCLPEEKSSVRNSVEVLVEHIKFLQDELPLTLAATETARLSLVSVNSSSTTQLEMTETMSDADSVSVLGNSLRVVKREQSELM